MSSHEVAQAASHEQTREEVKTIAQSTSTRLQFTAKPVAIARESMKRQIYCGLMAFGDPFFYSHVPSDLPLSKDVLEKMGFTYADPDEQHVRVDRHRRVIVDLKKTALDLWMFASTRDGQDRPNDAQMAQVMATMAQQLLANPLTAQAIGAHQAIMIANQIAQLAGLPRDFKLMDMTPAQQPQQPPSPEEQQAMQQAQQQQAQQQLQQVVGAVLQQITPQLQQELAPIVQLTKQNSSDIASLARALNIQAPPNPAEDDSLQQPALNGSPGRPAPAMA
jgi:hypothetical protein